MIAFLINILCFLLFLLAGSLFMCGWYKITRPGMILGRWSQWWEELTKDGRQYTADIAEMKHLKELAIESKRFDLIEDYGSQLYRLEDDATVLRRIKGWYKRPAFLVHPFSGCVYCFASVYGSLFYWIVGYTINAVAHYEFQLTYHFVVLWLTYSICAAALNGILIKKVL